MAVIRAGTIVAIVLHIKYIVNDIHVFSGMKIVRVLHFSNSAKSQRKKKKVGETLKNVYRTTDVNTIFYEL